MLTGNVVECDDTRGDHEFLQDVADAGDLVPVAITYVDGTVYQGRAVPSSEINYSNQAATLSFDMTGAGKFTPQ